MKDEKHLIRRSQSLSPFGVGAILDQQGESFVPADITFWKGEGEILIEERLQSYLGVTGFRMVPAAPDNYWEADDSHPGIPCVRFPFWYFCPICRKMSHRPFSLDVPICDHCRQRQQLVPMRFVMACPRGHLEDIPWSRWAHSNNRDSRCRSENLVFLTDKGGGGLEFLSVKCLDCGDSRSLAGIAGPDSMRYIGVRCSGRQPWQTRREGTPCDAVPQVLQRGATNLTFAQVESAIEIPPWSRIDAYSDEKRKFTSDRLYPALQSAYDSGNISMFEQLLSMMADQCGMEIAVARNIAMGEMAGGFPDGEQEMPGEDRETGLLEAEYRALIDPDESFLSRDRFIKRTVNLIDVHREDGPHDRAIALCLERLGMLVQVKRLREVRALLGFSRLSPVESLQTSPDEDPPGHFSIYGSKEKISPRLVPADLGQLKANARWLPAIQVFGEGIFFTLNEKVLHIWETDARVIERAKRLEIRRQGSAGFLPAVSPRFLLLHTLSHLLIRQLSFDCGYSVASLRERLYVRTPEDGEPMAGVLIYTAAGDAEGTLGGLVRQGKADRMLTTLLKTIQDASWCSSDPLCRESHGQGLHALNLAACHACSLLPETSCIHANRLLDRITITGSDNGDIPGFFEPVLNLIQTSMEAS